VIQAKGDRGLTQPAVDAESGQLLQFSDLACELIEHSGEHYGQLVVYYRIARLVPPESRPKKLALNQPRPLTKVPTPLALRIVPHDRTNRRVLRTSDALNRRLVEEMR
jgi:hypothetical protein